MVYPVDHCATRETGEVDLAHDHGDELVWTASSPSVASREVVEVVVKEQAHGAVLDVVREKADGEVQQHMENRLKIISNLDDLAIVQQAVTG